MPNAMQAIESVFRQFGVDAIVDGVVSGPSVERYEVKLGDGVRISKVAKLAPEIAYAMAVDSVRIVTSIPGKSAIGVELPREKRETVSMADAPVAGHALDFPVGKSIDGEFVVGNLGKMPHLLVAGCTGSGKSSFINALLVSLIKSSPERVQLCLIDPKRVELSVYGDVPHLIRPVVTEPEDAIEALEAAVDEMESRYESMQAARVRHADGIALPYLVIVIDELADLMMTAGKQAEQLLVRLAQKGRAAGIHLVVATQRPSVDIVTGLIRSNIPSRLAFSAASAIDSRIMLDQAGAEQLLGAGDALYMPIGAKHPVRVQGVLVTDKEVADAVDAVRVTARVEDMVEQLHPDPLEEQGLTVFDYLNTLIENAEAAGNRAETLVNRFCKPKGLFNRGGKTEILVEMPNELDRAAEALRELAQGLAIIRDQALVDA